MNRFESKGESMSEEVTKNLDSTSPLPFEEFVRENIVLLLKQGAELREQQIKLQEQQAKMYQETIEGFTEVGRQLRLLNERQAKGEEQMAGIKEDIQELDYKVDVFIREQIKIKRGLDEVRESVSLAPGAGSIMTAAVFAPSPTRTMARSHPTRFSITGRKVTSSGRPIAAARLFWAC
jgi:hypothetical protein